jgi:RNA-directed DNA polymerase
VLANIFMRYAFDAWMDRTHPHVTFERYCDDIIVHCDNHRQAVDMQDTITQRLATFGLELHPDRTKFVYCWQEQRPRLPEAAVEFTFLGYTF